MVTQVVSCYGPAGLCNPLPCKDPQQQKQQQQQQPQQQQQLSWVVIQLNLI